MACTKHSSYTRDCVFCELDRMEKQASEARTKQLELAKARSRHDQALLAFTTSGSVQTALDLTAAEIDLDKHDNGARIKAIVLVDHDKNSRGATRNLKNFFLVQNEHGKALTQITAWEKSKGKFEQAKSSKIVASNSQVIAALNSEINRLSGLIAERKSQFLTHVSHAQNFETKYRSQLVKIKIADIVGYVSLVLAVVGMVTIWGTLEIPLWAELFSIGFPVGFLLILYSWVKRRVFRKRFQQFLGTLLV